MNKIKYNISKDKRINYNQFALYCLVLVVVSALFLIIGINNLSVKDKKLQEEKEQQEMYRTKMDEMKEKTGNYNREIKILSRKWRGQVRFSNSLIANKTVNIIGKLDLIEELLPVGVYINSVLLRADAGSRIIVTVVADSFNNLFEVYKNFSKYDPIIEKETVDEGIHSSKINLKLTSAGKDEKK